MTNMSIQPSWLTHVIEILLVLEFQLTKFSVGMFSYKAHFRPQISSNATSFAVLVNGSPSNFFRASRGLRQGLLLSPFLFLIIEDALSRIIQHAKREGSFKGIRINNTVELSHILFVDDVVMLGEGSWGT